MQVHAVLPELVAAADNTHSSLAPDSELFKGCSLRAGGLSTDKCLSFEDTFDLWQEVKDTQNPV